LPQPPQVTAIGIDHLGGMKFPDSIGLQVLKCRVSDQRDLRHPSSYHGRGCEDGHATEHPASQS
jgi:hypothetical protein